MKKLTEDCMEFCQEYISFLNCAKTERETVSYLLQQAEKVGFEDILRKTEPLSNGDKVYFNWMDKAVALFVVGKEKPEEGINFVISHTDSPRLDLKANPLYEKHRMTMLKTHYYGGVKKYQWGTIPLALHGVVPCKDGTIQKVVIGEEENDPVFYVSDLPKHLSKKQMDRKLEDGLQGEELNLICGGMPAEDVLENTIHILKERYGIDADDFSVSEIEAVPSGKAKSVGFDSSLISAYGHDDRICVYTSLKALLETTKPLHTAAALFMDKEEIGSVGSTSMQSYFMENAVAELLERLGGSSDLRLRRTLAYSKMLSADVVVAFDPTFTDAFDVKNTASLGGGVTVAKYLGSNGKKGANDANAEYLGALRSVFEKHDVQWQTGEMGRIDLGGGGSMSHMGAKYGMPVVDCGPALLSMHAPFELASKNDVYETYKAYRAFYTEM